VLTLRNPALVVREVSELSAKRSGVTFRAVSLKPLNPGNAPDGFETRALRSFTKEGKKEAAAILDSPRGKVYRYVSALVTERPCLACHALQGYREGDIRGPINPRGYPA